MSVGTNNGKLQSTALTADGVCYADANGLVQTTTAGTAGQVLTSNGAGVAPTFQAGAASSITIAGDIGTPATGNSFTFNAKSNSGSSVLFSVAGTTLDLKVSDAIGNTIMGFNGGNNTLTGNNNTFFGFAVSQALTSATQNCGIGAGVMQALTSGNENTSCGFASLNKITTGINNIAVGFQAGTNYTSSESSNIVIGTSVGTVADSNTIRIGVQGSGTGQQNKCFIAGITGVTVSNQQFVTINTSTGQLGSTAGGGGITTLAGDTGTATGSTITFLANAACGSSVSFAASSSQVNLNVTDVNNNTIIGNGSGNGSISGTNNAIFGNGSAPNLTTGASNTLVGPFTAFFLTSGTQNACLGDGALNSVSTGNGNLALGGNNVLSHLTTGSSNISIGVGSGNNYTSSESSNILISNQGVVSESNVIRIGTQGSGDTQQNKCFIAGIAGVTVTSSAAVLINTSTGQLGTISSSLRYKENIIDLGNISSSIFELRPVAFDYKSSPSNKKEYGLIAEEVHKILPELVLLDAEGKPDSVQYHILPVLLLNEIIKLKQEIEVLKNK